MDRGEVLADEVRALVRDVEVDAVDAVLLDLEVDRAGDDVARGELGALVVARHEALAVRQLEDPALAAHRLGNEEGLGVRVEEAGRVELDELHVRHRGARAPSHRDAVAGRGVGVGRVEVDLPRAPRGEEREARPQGAHGARLAVEDVGAPDPVHALCVPELARGDEVDGDMPLQHLDVRVALHPADQGVLHHAASGVGGVHDAPVAVAPLAGEVQVLGVVAVAGELHPLRHQPFDRPAAALDHEPDGIVMAQARPGDVRVADVVLVGVGSVQDRGDPPLGPARGPVEELVLGHQRRPEAVFGQVEGGGHARQAATDDQDVVCQLE